MSGKIYIRNLSRPDRPILRVRYCNSFLCRLRGLTFRRDLPPGEGLLLVQAKDSRLDAAIHMLFMWMDLAVVWINTSLQVVDVKPARRWRLAYFPQKPARYVLEMPLERIDIYCVGDQLAFEKPNAS
jgi:uncharacterized membrane protein (UPF0127 family)